MLYYFKKGKRATEMQKIYAVYGEGAVTDQTYQEWFVEFRAGEPSLDGAPRSGQLKLIGFKATSIFHHAGDSRHSQNIQVNKIGENENCVFYLTEKNVQTFWLTQY